MMSKKTFFQAFMVASCIGVAASASAGSLFYAGADVGQAELDSSSNTAYGFHVGTGIIPFIGVEAGYWDFGSFNQADYTSFYLAAKPGITLGPVFLYAKFGLDWYDKDASYGKSDDGVDFMYGAGAEWFLGSNISLGASYTNFGFDKDDIDTLTFSATFHFL